MSLGFLSFFGYFLPTFFGLISLAITSLGEGITYQVLCYFFSLIHLIKPEPLSQIVTEMYVYCIV